jgi:hypothetical protein
MNPSRPQYPPGREANRPPSDFGHENETPHLSHFPEQPGRIDLTQPRRGSNVMPRVNFPGVLRHFLQAGCHQRPIERLRIPDRNGHDRSQESATLKSHVGG